MKIIDYVADGKQGAESSVAGWAGRYQIFRQTRNGLYSADWRCEEAGKAVDAFLRAAPFFEGGEIRLWDYQARRVVGSVKWQTEETEFGFFVQKRINIFHDRALVAIVRQIRRGDVIGGLQADADAVVPRTSA